MSDQGRTEPAAAARDVASVRPDRHGELTAAIVATVTEPLLVLDRGLRVELANPAFLEQFHLAPEATLGQQLYALGNGQWDIPDLRRLLEEVLGQMGRVRDYRLEHAFEGIGPRIMLLSARRFEPEHLILLAFRDITQERRAEARQGALMGELQHRIKNILNNVRAIAAQTRHSSPSLEAFAEAFDARLRALARAQDLLVHGPLEKVRLEDLVRFELEAAGANEPADFTLRGPADFTLEGPEVRLSPRDAQAMAMTVHELTTNALKYGALSVDGGRIEVAWQSGLRDGRWHLRLRWREHGLALQDRDPRRGFGARVIENSLPYILGGSSKLSFHADGVECVIAFPLPQE